MKPVAWSCWNEDMPCAVILVTEPNMYEWQSIKPLYTAPRELSDEEILELTNDSNIFEYREFNDDMVRFARAILKKANEFTRSEK